MPRKPILTIDILGTPYEVLRQRVYTPKADRESGLKWVGYAENPLLYVRRPKKIIVASSLRGKLLCEVLAHELLHALDFSKDESWVEHGGEVMAEILTHPEFAELIYDHV